MIKYVVYDENNESYIISKENSNFVFTYDAKLYNGVAFNFSYENTNNGSDIYEFYCKVKDKNIKNIEIYYVTEEKESKVFDFNSYKNLRIYKVIYDIKNSISEKQIVNEKITFMVEEYYD